MSCKDCKHWEPVMTPNGGSTATTGECHRYPPSVITHINASTLLCRFPVTPDSERCGEYDLRTTGNNRRGGRWGGA